MEKKRHWIPMVLIGLVCALYAYALFGSSDRFTMTPFREAQTAITSYYMAKGESPFLAYEVPVLGQPWAVPMEFPLFQWMAAKTGGDTVDTLRWAGRLISFLFWLGCLVLGYLIAKRAPIQAEDRKWFVLLLAAAPIFIAYGSAFLIESFTLFFALAYLLAYLKAREGGRGVWLVVACLVGMLAALSKPTTWAPFAGVIVLISGVELLGGFKNRDELKHIALRLIKSAIIVVVPMACALVWVHYGDQVKLENPLAASLTSEGLARWNYGTLSQKLSPRVWGIILGKQSILVFGIAGLLVPLLVIWAGLKSIGKNEKVLLLIWLIIALGGYFSAPVVFTNLHFRHDYYAYANGFFLLACLVLAISLLRNQLGNKWTRLVYMVVFLSSIVTGFGYLGLKKRFIDPNESVLVETLKQADIEGPVIFFGFSWSSNMPYELERRALMITFAKVDDPKLPQIIENNKALDWSAVAIASPMYLPLAEETMRQMNLELPSVATPWPGMMVYTKGAIEGASSETRPEILDRIARKLEGRDVPDRGIVYVHTFLSPANEGEGLFELMLRRGSDVFYIDGKNLQFVRLRNYFLD